MENPQTLTLKELDAISDVLIAKIEEMANYDDIEGEDKDYYEELQTLLQKVTFLIIPSDSKELHHE